MRHIPAFIEAENKTILVVGGGAMAARRAAVAQRAKANVIVVSVRLSIEFEDLKEFKHKARNFRPSDLDGVVLVFVSDDDKGN